MVKKSLTDFYFGTQRYEQAIVHGKQFLLLKKNWDEPTDLEMFYLLAQAYSAIGNTEESIRYYQLTLDTTRNKKFAKKVSAELSEITVPAKN